MLSASRLQAASLKKRWKRDQCPLATLPLEKMMSVMKRWRCERTQPEQICPKVRKVGSVKTGMKLASRSKKDWVSSMSRLPCRAILSCLATPKMPKNGREADTNYYLDSPLRNLRNSNLARASSWLQAGDRP